MDIGTDTKDCEEYKSDLAELSLGVLTGLHRSRALAHIEGCASCDAELEDLSMAADGLLMAMGTLDPPDGFVERTVGLLKATPSQIRRGRGRILLGSAAAVVVLAIGLSIGIAVSSSGGGVSDRWTAAAAFTSSVGAQGNVVVSESKHGWLFVTLGEVPGQGSVECSVVTDQGAHVGMGTFSLLGGYGSWALRLPVPPRSLRSVVISNKEGATLATAVLPA